MTQQCELNYGNIWHILGIPYILLVVLELALLVVVSGVLRDLI